MGYQAMKAAAALVALWVGIVPGGARSATLKPIPVGCASFMKDFPTDAIGHRAAFERPLTISRGFGDALSGVDVYILSSDTEVDGTLKCRGDELLRFEARVTVPAKDKTVADFGAFQQAALMAAFHWDRPKAQTIATAMSQDAGEYLRASIERGDIYNSGKVEYHQAERLDLGLIWTQTDRSFVIASQTED
jgi:hypothetical protein